MKSFILAIILLVSSLGACNATASSKTHTKAVAVDLLIGSDNITGVRLAYRPHVFRMNNILFFDHLDIYWEVSINFWEFVELNLHETNYAIAVSPVIGQTFYHINDKYPVRWEFGIGISLVEDTHFAGKDIGSHYQFEDRLGIAVDFGEQYKHSISVRYMHYSNGGLNSKNPGLDFLNMSYSYSF